jgi:SPOR domain
MRALLLFFLWMTTTAVPAQDIQVNEEPRAGELTRAWIAANRKNAHIEGWRVQILSTTDRQQADAAKLKFQSEFPGTYADWVHEKPYYKLRVGACRNKMEAMALLNDLKDYYPGAYVAKDTNIHPRDFLNRQ